MKLHQSPIGHQEIDLMMSTDTDNSKTMGSNQSPTSEGLMSSGSSYMDIELYGRAMTDYGPMRIAKDQEFNQIRQEMKAENQPVPNVSIPVVSQTDSYHALPDALTSVSRSGQLIQDQIPYSMSESGSINASISGNFSGSVDFTSTPNTKVADIQPLARLSEVTELASLESSTHPETQTAMHGGWSNIMPSDNSSSSGSYRDLLGMTNRDTTEFPESKERTELSQYSLKSDTPGYTMVGQSTEAPTEDFSELTQSAASLSQYTMDTTGKTMETTGKTPDIRPNDSSLTQITMTTDNSDFSKHIDQSPAQQSAKMDPSLSQYTLNSENDPCLSLSQYSIDKNSPGMGGYSGLSTTNTTQELSQYSLGSGSSSPGSDEVLMEKKFANLDQLIAESRNIIAKHKEMVNKQSATDQNQSASDVYGALPQDKTSTPNSARVSTSFDLTEDTTPMQFTDESNTQVTSSMTSMGVDASTSSYEPVSSIRVLPIRVKCINYVRSACNLLKEFSFSLVKYHIKLSKIVKTYYKIYEENVTFLR